MVFVFFSRRLQEGYICQDKLCDDVWQFTADQEILTKDSKVSLFVFPHFPLTIMLNMTSDRVGGRATHVNRMPSTMK